MYYDRLRQRVERATAQRKRRREAARLLDSLDIKRHIAEVYHPVHDDIKAGAHSIYNLPGGRGSGKSSFVGIEIVEGVMSDPSGLSNAVVFRKVGRTLRDSVYNQISWAIDTLGVSHLWRGTVSPMEYTYTPTGAKIIFLGLDDASKRKSIKPPRGIFRYIWFEEFNELNGENFVRSVIQSCVRGGDGFIQFRSFNPPISARDWANELIAIPDKRALTVKTNYTQMPPEWLGEAFIEEAERLLEVNPAAYQHEYMGEPIGSGGEVFPNLTIRTITDEEAAAGYIYQGQDFGFAVDPACFVRLAYDRKRETIMLLDEIYACRKSNTWLAEQIIERKYNMEYVTCDSAEPKSIADLRDMGIAAVGCTKYPGCVEYRIKWLQHRNIIIDPERTPNAYREFTRYCYESDKDGNLISSLPDKDNHSIDAVAYALDRVIGKRGSKA